MPAHVLIVEGDAALSSRLRSALVQRGHSVEETPDGRELITLARRRRPELIVLSVELPGGQNGYLLVGKLRKDDELRGVPVVIVGNPEGFAAHAKLKNRADEYLAKPVDIQGLVTVVERLTGTSEADAPASAPVEEEATVSGDPDLDLIDAAFDEAPRTARPAPATRAAPRAPSPPPPPPREAEDDFSSLGDDDAPTMVQMQTQPPAPPADLEPESVSVRLELTPGPLQLLEPEPQPESPQLELTPAALREMEAPEPDPLAGMRAALDDAQARAFAAEVRASQLETQLQEGASQAAPGRQEVARRDRETLRLKGELETAQQTIADLRDQQTQHEQKTLELSGELARRDAQLKGIQSKLDQAVQERRRLDQALQAARAGAGAAEQLEQATQELVAARRDLELNRAHAEGAERQLNEVQERAEAAEAELAELRAGAEQSAAQAGELEALHARVIDLEAEARKNEERVTRLYARLKSEERAREQARKAAAITAQLLAEPRGLPAEPEIGPPPDGDEPAVA